MNTASIKKPLRTGLVIVGASIIIAIISQRNKDFALGIGVLVICALLLLVSFKSRYRLVLRLLSAFILLHLLVFPIVYVRILKFDSKAFEFDGTIAGNEKLTSLSEIESSYSPKEAQENVELLSRILQSDSSILDTALRYLKEGNLIVVDSFILAISHERYPRPPGDIPAPMSPYLYITNSAGQLKNSFNELGNMQFIPSSTPIRAILQRFESHFKGRVEGYQSATRKIEKDNDIWTYRNILSYSVNIFFTSNMVPKSRMANVLVFLHNLIVVVFLLGTTVGVAQNFITSRGN